MVHSILMYDEARDKLLKSLTLPEQKLYIQVILTYVHNLEEAVTGLTVALQEWEDGTDEEDSHEPPWEE